VQWSHPLLWRRKSFGGISAGQAVQGVISIVVVIFHVEVVVVVPVATIGHTVRWLGGVVELFT
jgi:hypothetical protein